jgi:hypothetical protein
MPALVFPAPGCANGQRFPDTLLGFDILSSSGGTFVNLLRNSNDLTKSSWIKGSADGPTTGNYNIADWYINDTDTLPFNDLYVLANGYGDNLIITNTGSAYIGQVLTVSSNTAYTASFFAKRGSATNMSYGIYDLTNSSTIVSPTSYYNQTTSTYTKISFSFTTNPFTSEIAFYPLWTIASGSPGSVNIAAPQVEIGNTATGYNSTLDVSFAALGVASVVKQSYGITRLSTFSDPTKNFDSIIINGQSKVKWNIVNEYIFDSNFLTYSGRTGNNVLEITGDFASRPYNVGDVVTVSNNAPVYRQNFTVTSFTTSTVTINTTATIPYNGALLTNPNPAVFPQSSVYTSFTDFNKATEVFDIPRKNLFAVTYAPNTRGVSYTTDRNFQQFNIPNTGKVNVINRIKTPLINYQPGKVTSVIRPREIAPNRLPNVVQSFTTATGFLSPAYASAWPSGIYKLSYEYLFGTVLTIDTVFLPGGFIGAPQFENIYRLESFDNQGVYVGPTVGVSGTDNIKPFDSVGDYINDYSFTASTYVFPYPGYLYFNPAQTNSIQRTQFPLGSYVKVSNTFTGYSEVTMVLESNLNNILVTLAPEFPNNYLGGTTIQDASPFYYPKEKVVQDIGHVQLPIENIELPRTNLFYSEYRPLIPGRAVVYEIDKAIGNDTIDLSQHINRMETFQDSRLPGDFILPITGQNSEVQYAVVSWYTNESDTLAASSATSIVKTIYFPIQGATVYASSSTIRIKNTSINYDRTFSVITGTNYSVTILDPDDFPAGSNTTIEKAESTVYQQQYVKTTTRPTNARENLYYFNLAQGYRYNSTVSRGIAFVSNTVDTAVPKVSSVTRLKTTPTSLTVDKLTASIRVKGIPTVVSSSTFVNRMETFQDSIIPGDFLLPIVGQNTEVQYAVVDWYTNESDILTKSSSTSIVKTIYFPSQITTVYPSSSPIRIRDASINYNRVFSVITGTNFSVTILDPDDFPTGSNATIETAEFSVYPQRYVKTTTRPTNSRENLYYFNMTPGYLNNRTYSYGNTFATDNTIVRSANLSKQIQSLRSDRSGITAVGKLRAANKVSGDTVRLQIGKTASVSTVRGDRVATLYPGVIQPIKFRFDTNQIFFTPGLGNLAKQIAKLTAGYEGLSVELLVKPIQVLKEDRVIINVGKTVNVSLLRSDNTRISADKIAQFTVKPNTVQMFDTPTSGKLQSAIVVKDTNIIITVNQLSKQIAIIKDTNSIVQQGKLQFAFTVKDTNTIVNTGVINNPILRLSDIANLYQFGAIENPIRFFNNQLFFTPSFGKLSSAAKLIDIIGTTTVTQLSKQIAVIRDTNSIVQQGRLQFALTVKDQAYNINPGIIQPIKFLNNQLFFTPEFGKTVSITKVIADGNRLDVAKLSAINKFKEVRQTIDPGAITKFKFSVLYSAVFFLPDTLGKLAAAIKVKADDSKLTIGKTTAVSRLKDPVSQFFDTGITDNYFDQTNYAAITVPNSPAAWYRYFNIAPGFRASLTYQQGFAVAPDYTTIKSDRLSTFDNEGLVTDPYLDIIGSTDPIVIVTGRTNQFTTDVVLWYIDERDVLTLLPVGSETLTLYFRIMSWITSPFVAGNRVWIKSNTTGYNFYATVLSADAGSITIVEPIDFPGISDMTIQHVEHITPVTVYFTPQLNKIPYPVGSYVRITNNLNTAYSTASVIDAGLNYVTFNKPADNFALPAFASATIASASIAVYPREQVRTSVPSNRARENLYYAEMAPGRKYGVINTAFGSSVSENSFNIDLTSMLNRDSVKHLWTDLS